MSDGNGDQRQAMEDALSRVASNFKGAMEEMTTEIAPVGDMGEEILRTAGSIVLAKLQEIREKQLEEGHIKMSEANYALSTLRIVQRQKELMAWSNALSNVDGDELRQALRDLREMKKTEKVITLDKQRIS